MAHGSWTLAAVRRYAHGSRGVAVRACKDGSVTVQWPSSGDIAITVDADHSHAPPTYRMLAMYRHTCGVAASWDQNGGFIQYPNGTVCMNYSVSTSKTGSGEHMNMPHSEVLHAHLVWQPAFLHVMHGKLIWMHMLHVFLQVPALGRCLTRKATCC